jgi:hypothetical protein
VSIHPKCFGCSEEASSTLQPPCAFHTLSVALMLLPYARFSDDELEVVGEEAISHVYPYFLTISLISL